MYKTRDYHFQYRQFSLSFTVAVVICFFLCWAPFHAQRLIAVYGSNVWGGGSENVDGVAGGGEHDDAAADDKNHHVVIYTVMTYVSGVLYYLSTCINPLLYNLMSNKFRQASKVCNAFTTLCINYRHTIIKIAYFRC